MSFGIIKPSMDYFYKIFLILITTIQQVSIDYHLWDSLVLD